MMVGVIAMSKLFKSQIRNLKSVLLSKMSRSDAIFRFEFSKSQCRHAIGNVDYQSHNADVQLIIQNVSCQCGIWNCFY